MSISDDYTPTTAIVRGVYAAPQEGVSKERGEEIRAAREVYFDRWLAAHDAHLRRVWEDQQRREHSMFGDDFPEW